MYSRISVLVLCKAQALADALLYVVRPGHDQADHGSRLDPRHGQSPDWAHGRSADLAEYWSGLH